MELMKNLMSQKGSGFVSLYCMRSIVVALIQKAA